MAESFLGAALPSGVAEEGFKTVADMADFSSVEQMSMIYVIIYAEQRKVYLDHAADIQDRDGAVDVLKAIRGQDIERAQIYAKRLCAHLWVDSMRRRLQHSKGIHRTVVASPLVAEPAYRQRRDSVVRHLRKYCLGNTFQHEAVSIRDMAKDFG
jgi:hypothetical protein